MVVAERGALDPIVWVAGPVDGIGSALDQTTPLRIREAHFVLHPCADGIPGPQSRFEAIKSWMQQEDCWLRREWTERTRPGAADNHSVAYGPTGAHSP